MKKLLLSLLCMLTATAVGWAETYEWNKSSSNTSATGLSQKTSGTLKLNNVTWNLTASPAVYYVAFNSTNTPNGLQFGSNNSNSAASTISISNTANFSNKTIKSLSFDAGTNNTSALSGSVKIGDKSFNFSIEGGTGTTKKTITIIGANDSSVDTGTQGITLTVTTVKSKNVAFDNFSMEYIDTPTGPVDPTWTLTAPTGLTYGDNFTAADCYDANGTGLNPTGYTLKYIPFADSATAPSDETWKATEALANVTYPYTPNAGWYQLSATTEADTDGKYNSFTRTATFSVAKASQTIAFPEGFDENEELNIFVNTPYSLLISGAKTTLKPNSDDPKVTIEVKGNEIILTGIAVEDEDMIDIVAEATDNYEESNTLTFMVAVIDENTILAPTFTPVAENTEKGKVINLTYPNTKVSFASATEGVSYSYEWVEDVEEDPAEGDGQTNEADFKNAGTYMLYVTLTKGETKVEDDAMVIIAKATSTLAWEKDGEKVTAFPVDMNDTEVVYPAVVESVEGANDAYVYSSSDPTIATIDATTGAIKPLKAGTTKIEVMGEGSKNYDVTETAEYLLTVTDKDMPAVVTFSPANTDNNTAIGTVITLSTATEGAKIIYSVTDMESEEEIASGTSDSNSFEYTLNQLGEIYIAAHAINNGRECAETDETYEVVKAQPVITFANNEVDSEGKISTMPEGGKMTFTNEATLSGWYGEDAPTIEYSIETVEGPGTATVDANGLVTFTGTSGEFTITATAKGNEFNADAVASYILLVNEEKSEVTYNFSESGYGVPLQSDGSKWAEDNLMTNEISTIEFTPSDKYRYWSSTNPSNHVRLYYGGKMVINVKPGYLIESIAMTGKTLTTLYNGDTKLTTSGTSLNYKLPNPSSSFEILRTGTSSNSEIYTITVNYKKLEPVNVEMFKGNDVFDWSQEIDLEEAISILNESDVNIIDDEVLSHFDITYGPADGVTFVDITRNYPTANEADALKAYLSNEDRKKDILANDSWLYTKDQLGVDWTENASITYDNGNFYAKLPCSGLWKVTVNVKEGDTTYYMAEPVSANISIRPQLSGVTFCGSPESTKTPGNYFVPIAGHKYIEVQSDGTENEVVYTKYNNENIRLNSNGYLLNYWFKVEEAGAPGSKRKVSPQEEGYTLYTESIQNVDNSTDSYVKTNFAISSDGSQTVSLAVSKNGVSTLTPNSNSEDSSAPGKDFTLTGDDTVTAVEAVFGEAEDGVEAEVMVFTMQGVRVDAERLEPGLYIFCRGAETRKVLVK